MKPILFNTEMVRTILEGKKTVTRRIIKLKYNNSHIEWHKDKYGKKLVEKQNNVEGETYGIKPEGTHWQKLLAMRKITSPYKVGDILYVRETWSVDNHNWLYRADFSDTDLEKLKNIMRWGPSIHMPKKIARIFLRVVDVRVERVQDIDDDGVVAEGLEIGAPFDELWNSTVNKSNLDKYGWDANPWVWVIEFERISKEEAQ